MIINPWIFYVIDVLSDVEFLLGMIGFIGFFFTAWMFINWYNEIGFEDAVSSIWWKVSLLITIWCCLIVALIPSQETMYTMLVSSNVTDENVEIAVDVIKDSVDYIFEKLDGGE